MSTQANASRVTTQMANQQQRDDYLTALIGEAHVAAQQSALELDELRARAKALVSERSLPSNRDEDWRFCDLSAMLSMPYRAAEPLGKLAPFKAQVDAWALPEAQGHRLVFVNGQYAESLSSIQDLPTGVMIAPLSALGPDIGAGIRPDIRADIESYLAHGPGSNEVFTALNTTGFTDVAIIWVEKNQVVEQPIQVLHLSAAGAVPQLIQPRCLVVAAPNSALTLVEQFEGTGADVVNSVSELWLQDNAQVTHILLQKESVETYHIGKTAVSQARDSRYSCTAIALGAQLSRHNLEVYQTGPSTDTQLNGLIAIRGNQVADTHSLIALNHPHGTASQLQKNIVDDRAHGVFNGKVYVPHKAQMTNAAQLNRNLLLSDRARVDTKPELDIVADNVKCAHGATVSQLEADEIFYLQSRGIDQPQAQRLLLYAFAMEVIEKITVPSLRERLTQHITEWTL
ncbi:MAG: Fe-S cluster assembly protein SufD [Cyanobacteria bacterium P01_A01_bin.114]